MERKSGIGLESAAFYLIFCLSSCSQSPVSFPSMLTRLPNLCPDAAVPSLDGQRMPLVLTFLMDLAVTHLCCLSHVLYAACPWSAHNDTGLCDGCIWNATWRLAHWLVMCWLWLNHTRSGCSVRYCCRISPIPPFLTATFNASLWNISTIYVNRKACTLQTAFQLLFKFTTIKKKIVS